MNKTSLVLVDVSGSSFASAIIRQARCFAQVQGFQIAAFDTQMRTFPHNVVENMDADLIRFGGGGTDGNRPLRMVRDFVNATNTEYDKIYLISDLYMDSLRKDQFDGLTAEIVCLAFMPSEEEELKQAAAYKVGVTDDLIDQVKIDSYKRFVREQKLGKMIQVQMDKPKFLSRMQLDDVRRSLINAVQVANSTPINSVVLMGRFNLLLASTCVNEDSYHTLREWIKHSLDGANSLYDWLRRNAMISHEMDMITDEQEFVLKMRATIIAWLGNMVEQINAEMDERDKHSV